MSWNSGESQTADSEVDLATRRQLHRKVTQWRVALPEHLREDINFTPQTCFLRVYMDEVLVSVLRPLDPNTVFLDDLTVKDICLGLAYTDTTYMMRYIKEYTLRDYSCVVLCGLYNALFTMAPYLGDPTIHQLFAETSYLMRQTARDFPMSSFILQAIKAFAWTSSLPLPIAAAPYFEDLGMTKQELQDLPLGFALPKTNEIRDIFMREGQELSGVAVDMGKLLSRWCTLSLDE
ncbi:hypothetical protein ACHAP1_000092 [Verticillium nonalfalfae]